MIIAKSKSDSRNVKRNNNKKNRAFSLVEL